MYSFNVRLVDPSPDPYTHYYHYDRHSVWPDFPGNAHDTVDETSPPVVPQNRQTVTCSDATTPIHIGCLYTLDTGRINGPLFPAGKKSHFLVFFVTVRQMNNKGA